VRPAVAEGEARHILKLHAGFRLVVEYLREARYNELAAGDRIRVATVTECEVF
jgi:20S proteasome alpha/beta subunit